MKRRFKFTALILIFVILITSLSACGGGESKDPVNGIYSFMQTQGRIDRDESLTEAAFYQPGDSLTDWAFIFAALAGKESDAAKEEYLADLEAKVTAAYAAQGGLSDFRATEWHRAALAILVLGGDPTSFGTDAEGNKIDLIRDGIFCWKVTPELDSQGGNALIYALLVLNAGDFAEPEGATYTEDGILEKLLAYQGEDGSFGLAPGGGDVDVTAMSLQALAPYCGKGRNDVDKAVERALDFLSAEQVKGGYFLFGNGFSCETCAQVIMALASLGIDPEKDERFMKAGKSPEDALLTFRNDDGGFGTGFENDGSLMKSEIETSRQAGCALLALRKLRETGDGKLFDL